MKPEIDRQSATWRAVMERAETRLDELRMRNDAASLTHEQTLVLRGRIAEIKELLALDSPVPAQLADEA